jgi:hypothetical protein
MAKRLGIIRGWAGVGGARMTYVGVLVLHVPDTFLELVPRPHREHGVRAAPPRCLRQHRRRRSTGTVNDLDPLGPELEPHLLRDHRAVGHERRVQPVALLRLEPELWRREHRVVEVGSGNRGARARGVHVGACRLEDIGNVARRHGLHRLEALHRLQPQPPKGLRTAVRVGCVQPLRVLEARDDLLLRRRSRLLAEDCLAHGSG